MPADSGATPSVSIADMAIDDHLLALARERRSGTLIVRTSKGSGEIFLVDGEVIDAVYLRLEGMKAIVRLLEEREGDQTYSSAKPTVFRRMQTPTLELVKEARELSARASELRSRIGELGASTLMTVEGSPPADVEDFERVDRLVMDRLRTPSVIDAVLEGIAYPDAVLLESVVRLHGKGIVRSLGVIESRVRLCGADQLHLVRASASRAQSLGFSGPARIVFAATPSRLAVFSHTVLSLSDSVAPEEPMPSLPVPFPMAVIHLGDGVELEIVALPLVPAYAPLWAMTLGGSAIVVKLDEAATVALEETCTNVGVPILDARAIFGVLEETSAVQVASLIKTALDAEA